MNASVLRPSSPFILTLSTKSLKSSVPLYESVSSGTERLDDASRRRRPVMAVLPLPTLVSPLNVASRPLFSRTLTVLAWPDITPPDILRSLPSMSAMRSRSPQSIPKSGFSTGFPVRSIILKLKSLTETLLMENTSPSFFSFSSSGGLSLKIRAMLEVYSPDSFTRAKRACSTSTSLSWMPFCESRP